MAPLRPFLLIFLSLAVAATSLGASPAEAMRIMKSNCFSCHNEEKQKGGLTMTSRAALLKGGESGPALTEGAPEKSGLIAALEAGADPHMPPKKQLTPAQVAALAEWVKEGAKWDAAALTAEAAPTAPRKVELADLPATYHPVLALALSPDGQRLAVGCAHRVLLYKVEQTKLTLLAEASAHLDPVQSIAWSADGMELFTGAFRRLVIWKTEPLERAQELTEGLTDRITAIRVLPGGQLVVADGSVAQSGIVRQIDPAATKIVASWTAHADTIFDLAVSPDGKTLATAGGDKLVKLWDLATHKELAKLEGHVAQVLAVAFDKEGKQLLSGGADQQLKVWDVATRERIIALGTHTSAVNAVAWIATGPTVFAATGAGTMSRYTDLKAHTGDQRSDSAKERKLDSADNTIYCLAASTDAERVFAGLQDGRVQVWDKNGKIVTTIQADDLKATAALSK